MAGTGKIYVKKVYPIKGRRDFFKYVVMDSGKIARGFSGNKWDREMYFDTKASANRVANARKKVQKANKEWMRKKITKTSKKKKR
jgi:hypothetical protein